MLALPLRQSRSKSKKFWNQEYKNPVHLALSLEPAEDLLKFTRWLERQTGRSVLNLTARILDLGCGNGRNLIYLAKEFGCRGVGYDSSAEAINQAKKGAGNLPLELELRSLTETINLPDCSVNLVLDMMSSHVLDETRRAKLRDEVWRVLKPGGWFFFKTFLLEEDLHAKRLLRDYPAEEPNSYLHPELGTLEHVWTTDEIVDFFDPQFVVHKISKSHKHLSRGRAFRRRTVSVYLEKRD